MFKLLTLSALIVISGFSNNVSAAEAVRAASEISAGVPISARYTVQDCKRDGGYTGRGGLICYLPNGTKIHTDL